MKNSIWLSILFVAAACGGSPKPAPEPTPDPTPAQAECVAGGCSGTVCTDEEGVMTTCEWRPEYACYQNAECKRQDDGACGWTQSETLTACLASPPVE
jgi:eight-cysteine-cluster-containing protein